MMKFAAAAETDIGLRKATNQDSMLIDHAKYGDKEVMLAVVCDGMGGLAKGELASATVIRTFDHWFHNELPYQLDSLNLSIIGERWSKMLKNLNQRIYTYGVNQDLSLGTTTTAVLMIDDQYVSVHIGDSRLYQLTDTLIQLTQDQTFVAREIAAGRMTPEQAKTDRRRSMLLQCVGASINVEPAIAIGRVVPGTYMLCSDGFRHVISPQEIFNYLCPANQGGVDDMHRHLRELIEMNKARNERDNISALLIYAGQE